MQEIARLKQRKQEIYRAHLREQQEQLEHMRLRCSIDTGTERSCRNVDFSFQVLPFSKLPTVGKTLRYLLETNWQTTGILR